MEGNLAYVPDSYDASKPTPLLFMFHGFGGDNTSSGGSAERNYYGWQDTAEENGFITIFPEAQGWFKAWDLSPNGRSSDIGYVENLIDWAGDNYNISESDLHHWTLLGAYFSYYVAANLSDKISALEHILEVFTAILGLVATGSSDYFRGITCAQWNHSSRKGR